jgi:SAM-dependent methyltransferase
MDKLKKKAINDTWYSIRRYFVDDFYIKNIKDIPPNSYILDMGGKKENKRGLFDIEKYNFNVKYANIDKTTNPDYHSDIANIPVENSTFDRIILAEVLEHLKNPLDVLKEAFRLLKPGGSLLICTPFMFHIHADPYDYARYTGCWYKENLENVGFSEIQIEKQGLIFCVLANMLKLLNREINLYCKNRTLLLKIKLRLFDYLLKWFIRKAVKWDSSKLVKQSNVLNGYTTGYGIICMK